MEELKARPQRKGVEAEVQQVEQRAFDRAFTDTRKQIAKEQGAAAGAAAALGDAPASAVAAARQRALGGEQPAPSTTTTRAKTPSGRIIQQPDGSRVPEEFYDLSPEQQKRFKQLAAEQESKEKDDNAALTAVNTLLDLREKDSARVKVLEQQLSTALAVIEAMQQRLDNQDNSLEVTKSSELAEQLAKLSDAVVGAAAVETSLRNQTVASQAEMDRQRDDHRQRLEATERVLGDMEGRLKSSGTLFQERSNAVVDQLAGAESRQAQLAVQQTENADGIARNADTLKAFTGYDLETAINDSVKRSFANQLAPELESLIERRYVLLSGTTGSDGIQQESTINVRPFLARQEGDNATERAVNRALKRGGKR